MKAEQPLKGMPVTNLAVLEEDRDGGLNFGQFVAAIRRKWWLVVGITTLVAGTSVLKALTDTPIYQSGFEILTEPVTAESEVIASNPDTLSNRSEELTQIRLDDTLIKVLKSPKVIEPILETVQERYPKVNYGLLANKLKIAVGGASKNILTVTYQHPNPGVVETVLEVVSKAFLQYSLETRQVDIRRGIEFVEKQLPLLQNRVDEQQERLQQLRQQYNLVDPALRGEQLSQQVGSLITQALETNLQLQQLRSTYTALQKELTQTTPETAASSVLNGNPRYQSILNQLLDIDSRLAQNAALYRDNSPEMEVLQEQRRNLIPLLQREGQQVLRALFSQIQELEAKAQALEESVVLLNQNVKQLSGVTRQYNDIQRELEIATKNLNLFLEQREALRIDASQREVPWQLLTPPGSPRPSVASVQQSLILGTILGALLGMGVALATDKLSNVVYTTKDVKDATKLPILGIIPFNQQLQVAADRLVEWPMGDGSQTTEPYVLGNNHFPENGISRNGSSPNGRGSNETPGNWMPGNGRLELRYTGSPFLEAFRSLYTNLRLLPTDVPIRSLVVSSSAPQEGKSTIAAHLARAAAAMGQRVLLIDAHLRRPQAHLQFGLRNVVGLTNVIAAEVDFHQAIQPAPAEENLFVLTAGAVPHDPTRLLSSQQMRSVIAQALTDFDLLIYDAPPLLGIADAYLLSAYTDGLVMVIGLGWVKRVLLEQALEQVRLSNAPIAGIVVNGDKEPVSSLNSYYQPADALTPEGFPLEPADAANQRRSPTSRLKTWLKRLTR